MPLYYFHFIDPTETVPDHEGRTLPDLAAAKTVALGEARALISADALNGRISLLSAIAVSDEHGETLHIQSFAHAIEIIVPDFPDSQSCDRAIPSQRASRRPRRTARPLAAQG